MPWIARHAPRWLVLGVVALLGAGYVAARAIKQAGWPGLSAVLEVIGATWMGVLFLLFVPLLVVDVVTVFGFVWRRFVPVLRTCALGVGVVLAAIALVQGNRAPVVREFEIRLPGLPVERDATTLAFISDLHLGTLVGRNWLIARIAQIAALRPDLIVIGGDVLEGDDRSELEMLPLLRRLSAPLGVWAVAGNHEHHGSGSTLDGLEAAGVRVLRNEWRQLAPGLILAGVEDRRRGWDSARDAGPIETALANRTPGGVTILISHMPADVDRAARAGANLMLAGHTHDGQIWPFRYVVRLRFPYLAGRYDVDGMPLLVCRGTGTFGPPMRLWHPGEILHVTLRRMTYSSSLH
jgi:predicted MPP superfamily phosphohydrolase